MPEVFAQARERNTRRPVKEASAPIADTLAEVPEEGHTGDTIQEFALLCDPIQEITEMGEGRSEASIPAAEPATMNSAFHLTGKRRKELVKAISQITGLPATYQNAPTFAFAIGNYTVDKAATLTGAYDAEMVGALAEQGFIAG